MAEMTDKVVADPADDTDTDDLSTEELFSRLQGWFKEDRDHLDEWKEEARQDYAFYAGDQWSPEDRAKLEDENRPVIVFNRVAMVVDSVCGSEVNNRQETKYLPREQGDVQANEVLTAAAKYFRDECHADDEESDAFQDTIICGIGCTETRLDFDENPEGEAIIERIDPLEMVWDRSARRSNLLDARRYARVKDLSLQEARDMFPDADDADLDAAWARDEGQDGSPAHPEKPRYDGTVKFDAMKARVTIVHMQWAESEDFWRVIDPATNAPKDIDEDTYERLKAQIEALGIQATKVTKKVWRQAFLGSKMLSEPEPTLCNKPAWNFITGKRHRNNGTWFGLIRGMRDPQMWANKWLSQSLHILNSQAKGGILAEKGAFADEKQAEESWAKSDRITWASNGALQQGRIQPKPVSQMPAGFSDLLNFAVASIRDVSGINLEALGQADRDQAGVLEYQRRQAAMTILASLFNALRRYRKSQGKLLLDIITQYLTDGRLIRIVGQEGAQYVPLVREPGASEYDVIVDESPSSPNQKEATWAILQPMIQTMAPMMNGQMWIDLLPYTPLPSSVVEKLTKTITQAMQNPPPDPEQAKNEREIAKAQLQAQLDQKRAEMEAALEKQKMERDAAMAQQNAQHAAALEIHKTERQAEIERTQAQADIAAQRAKVDMDMRLAQQKFEFDKQLKLLEFQLKTATMKGEAAAQGQEIDLPEIDASAGVLKNPAAERHTQLLEAMQNMMKLMAAPKEVVRDENGRPVGVRHVIN